MNKLEERNKQVYMEREAGMRLRVIADRHGLSMERVRQIHAKIYRTINKRRRRAQLKGNKWYVFKPSRYGGVHAENYWTGEMTDKGDPAMTNKVFKAKGFDSAREAYEVAGKTRKLNWWRVGERKCEVFH